MLIALVAASGCATTASRVADRSSRQRFTGDPYDVWDEGRRITGSVCGLNVEYTVSHSGATTTLSGFADSGRPLYVEVRNEGAIRHITGALGVLTGANEVNLAVSSDRLRGRAGLRNFELVAVGDSFRGAMQALNTYAPVPALVDGRTALQQLPDAALGAILPPLLNCNAPFGRPTARPDVMVRVGGPAGYETRTTNEIR
jgi:hypothetical protein